LLWFVPVYFCFAQRGVAFLVHYMCMLAWNVM
jgi:hypothetical protein